MHSYRSVEHDGLLELAQTCIDIGATFGRVDVSDIWYGRQTIRYECDQKFNQYVEHIKSVIRPYINERTVSATADLWRDDTVQRYYLDFTVFYMDENWQLKHSLLRCKYFDEQSKTAINIWSEIESIFNEFNLIFGDTPITTDEGANIKASLKNEIR
jgi:DNA-binding XRE family transcriptional regulator